MRIALAPAQYCLLASACVLYTCIHVAIHTCAFPHSGSAENCMQSDAKSVTCIHSCVAAAAFVTTSSSLCGKIWFIGIYLIVSSWLAVVGVAAVRWVPASATVFSHLCATSLIRATLPSGRQLSYYCGQDILIWRIVLFVSKAALSHVDMLKWQRPMTVNQRKEEKKLWSTENLFAHWLIHAGWVTRLNFSLYPDWMWAAETVKPVSQPASPRSLWECVRL